MGRSKIEIELERMTAERDHWRKLAQERARELERYQMYAQSIASGFKDIDVRINALQQERDELRSERDLMANVHRIAKEIVPPFIADKHYVPEEAPIRGSGDRWEKTMVGVVIAVRDDDETFRTVTLRGLYNGASEVAQMELGARISEILVPSPTPQHLPKKPVGFEMIDDEHFTRCIVRMGLAANKDEAMKIKNQTFNTVIWSQMDNHADCLYTRDEAQDRWSKYINTTFDRYNKQRWSYIRVGANLFPEVLSETGEED